MDRYITISSDSDGEITIVETPKATNPREHRQQFSSEFQDPPQTTVSNGSDQGSRFSHQKQDSYYGASNQHFQDGFSKDARTNTRFDNDRGKDRNFGNCQPSSSKGNLAPSSSIVEFESSSSDEDDDEFNMSLDSMGPMANTHDKDFFLNKSYDSGVSYIANPFHYSYIIISMDEKWCTPACSHTDWVV